MAGVLSSEQHAVAAAGTVEHGGPDRRALVRGQLRLKWTLWRRSYRGNVGKIIGTAFGALYGLGGLALLVFAMLGLTLWSGEGVLFPTVLRGIGAATVLAWLLIPLLAFGVDDTLDARAFAPYPRSARELQPGLFAAAALSLPALFTLLAVAVVSAFEAIWMVAFGPGRSARCSAWWCSCPRTSRAWPPACCCRARCSPTRRPGPAPAAAARSAGSSR